MSYVIKVKHTGVILMIAIIEIGLSDHMIGLNFAEKQKLMERGLSNFC